MWCRPRSSRPASRMMAVPASTRRMPRRKPWALDPQERPQGPTRCGSAGPGPSGIGTARPCPWPRSRCPTTPARRGGRDQPGGWTSRRASHGHPHPRIHARSSGPPYRPSDATPRCRRPRSRAARIMAATAGVRGEPVGRLVPPGRRGGGGGPRRSPPGTRGRCLERPPTPAGDPRRGASSMGRAEGLFGAESSVTTAPSSRRTCGSASVRSVARSGSRRPGRRGTASSAGGPGPSGGTRAASGPERTLRSRGQDSDGIAGGNVRCAQAPRSNPEPPRADDPSTTDCVTPRSVEHGPRGPRTS